jgi:CTP:phosphocholine cytidylyltransferase-like protein
MLAMDTEQNYQEYTAHYSFALPSELLHNFSILDVSAYNTFSKEKILSNKIITNYTRIEADKTYVPKDIEEFILKNKQISLIQDEQDIYILSGIHYLSENTIFPI